MEIAAIEGTAAGRVTKDGQEQMGASSIRENSRCAPNASGASQSIECQAFKDSIDFQDR